MNTPNYIKQLSQLIADGEMAQAIKELQKLLENSPKLYEVLHQSGRYNEILQQIRLGIIDSEQATKTKNEIRFGLLDLLKGIEKEKHESILKDEIANYVSTVPTKNFVSGSSITAGGNVTIGDSNITNTESRTSKRIRLWLFVAVPILAISGAYLWYEQQVIRQPLSLKVLIANQTPHRALSEPRGELTLIYGAEPHTKEGISQEAIFENIPHRFRNKSLHLTYRAKGFEPIDTTFKFQSFIELPVRRDNELGILQGYVYQADTKPSEPLPGVSVIILSCCSTTTDQFGKFHLDIPFDAQRERQRVEFSKMGYDPRSTEEPIIKGEPIRIPLHKK